MNLDRALEELRKDRSGIETQLTACDMAIAKLVSLEHQDGRSSRNGNEPRTPARAPRRKMSASARKAVARRMKAYWAEKRKASKGRKGATASTKS